MKDWMSSALHFNMEFQNTNIQTMYVLESPMEFVGEHPEFCDYCWTILRRAYFSTPTPILTFLLKMFLVSWFSSDDETDQIAETISKCWVSRMII